MEELSKGMAILIWPVKKKGSAKSPDITGSISRDKNQLWKLRLWENVKDMAKLDGYATYTGCELGTEKIKLVLKRNDVQSETHPVFIGTVQMMDHIHDVALWIRIDKNGGQYYGGKIGNQHERNES